jgi:hypothetical protein
MDSMELFSFLSLPTLPLNLRNSLFVRKAGKRSAITNDFDHCLAVMVDQVCNVQREFLAVSVECFYPRAGIG